MTPAVHIERLGPDCGLPCGYSLSISDGRYRTASLIGPQAVLDMHCQSQAVIEDYWVNQTQHLKSWVMRFASGASLTALLDQQDQILELDAFGFAVVSAHRMDATTPTPTPLHLQDCLCPPI